MVGGAHVSVFKIIEEIQKEQNRVELEIKSIIRGLPRDLPKKKDREQLEFNQFIMIAKIEQSWIFFVV